MTKQRFRIYTIFTALSILLILFLALNRLSSKSADLPPISDARSQQLPPALAGFQPLIPKTEWELKLESERVNPGAIMDFEHTIYQPPKTRPTIFHPNYARQFARGVQVDTLYPFVYVIEIDKNKYTLQIDLEYRNSKLRWHDWREIKINDQDLPETQQITHFNSIF